jgi:myo-inositol-1(or 4)-monophosphatase
MPSPNSPIDLCNFARELAMGAGEILRTYAQHARTSMNTKSSSVDLVTDADTASEHFLVDAIRNRRPDDGILGEEGTNVTSQSGVQWIIDPLDGTTNFVYSIPFYAVSIGAYVDGVPTAGAVYNPVLDEMYSASLGGGAFLNDVSLQTNTFTTLGNALIATGFAYVSDIRAEHGVRVAQLLPHVRDIRRCGSAALDLCGVASGRVDAYLEQSVRPWDVAAGSVIASEAGARVTAWDGSMASTNVLAAPAPLYDELLPYLK